MKVQGPSSSSETLCLYSARLRLSSAEHIYALAAEITMFDEVVVVYKFIGDLMFFVTGSQDENELILYQVLQGFYEAVSLLLRYMIPDLPKRSTANLELLWPSLLPQRLN